MTARRQVLLLLVDDGDADQRQTLQRGLFLIGVDCLAARGLERLGEVDLLLADLTKPGAPGSELVDRALATRPELPVLVIAGLSLSPEALALRARGIPILRKPFDVDDLGRAIDALLGKR